MTVLAGVITMLSNVCLYTIYVYRIAQNFDDGKFWQIPAKIFPAILLNMTMLHVYNMRQTSCAGFAKFSLPIGCLATDHQPYQNFALYGSWLRSHILDLSYTLKGKRNCNATAT